MRDESVTVVIESFLRRQVQCPALSRPSEMAGFLEFTCSEKGMLVRPRTIRQSGPQLSLDVPDTQRSGEYCEAWEPV